MSRTRTGAPAATRARMNSAVRRIIAVLVGSDRCQQTLPPELRYAGSPGSGSAAPTSATSRTPAIASRCAVAAPIGPRPTTATVRVTDVTLRVRAA